MAPRHSGDLCPSRARPQAAGPPSGRTRAVGQIGPPAFLMPFPAPPAGTDTRSREALRHTSRIGPAAFVIPGTVHVSHPTLESPVTATLDPQLKNGSTSQPVQPLAVQPVPVRPDVHAGAPHRGRQQAVRGRSEEEAGDGHLARVVAPRARRRPRDPGLQRLRQVDAHPAHLRTADPRRRVGSRSSATTSSARRWRSSG